MGYSPRLVRFVSDRVPPVCSRAIQAALRPFCRVILVLGALLFMVAMPALAGTFTAYGPQNYTRGTGDPVTVTNTFNVLNPNTQYTLKVFNGGLQDSTTELVSSGFVTVNGVQVVGPNNFNQNVTEVDVPVTLAASNTISVQVRGQPGGVLTVEIIGVDNDPPVIKAAASPAPNAAGWNNTNVTVTFTCSDATSGVASCPGPQTVTAEGANQVITGTATDAAGNTASASVTLNIDKTPPSIVASASPAPNAAGWNNSNVTVSFTCSDALSGVATCPSSTIVSTEGANQVISGTATDVAGNTASASATVNLDKTPPVISITSPANGATFTSSSAPVSGSVTDALSGVAGVSCNGSPASVQSGSFSCSVTLTSGTNTITAQATDVAGNSSSASENVTFANNVTPPSITSFAPASGPIGTQITIAGSNFTGGGTGTPQVALSQQGGGSIAAPVISFTASSITFTIPAGAASGQITVTVSNQAASSAASLSVVPSSDFSVSAAPASATVQQGTSTFYNVSLSSTSGFAQLAGLSLSGLPSGLTASFSPTQITAGQTSILTITAPAGQSTGNANLTISAAATIEGIATNQSATVALTVQTASTSLIGRTVESDNNETPIPGITVTLLGVDDAGHPTGCSGQTHSDAAGNFALLNLATACLGRQLVGYDGNTATDGEKYAGVNLAYTMIAGQVTGPELVHMPTISDAETIMVKQNATVDQTFSYSTIPGVTVTVYAGTTLTMPDGTTPDPFPMAAALVPVDRLPDNPPPTSGTLRASIVAFQPANTTSSLPVSVTFPNVINTPPGVNMELDTLDPIVGELVKYGTGTVSADATEIVPDPDPARPGHRYGISHFDWHGPMAPAPNGSNPCPSPPCQRGGDPVDLSSGLLSFTKTDIAFGGARGQVSIQRTYRTLSGSPGPFGIGTNHNYGYELDVSNLLRGTGTFVTLVTPDGNQLQFVEQGTNTFVNSTIPNFLGAVITSPGTGIYNLRWKDGTVYSFQTSSQGALLAFLNSITDANGNTVTLVRNSSQPSQITQVIDPVGRALNIVYDNFSRILSITDPIGRSVQYSYNGQGSLATVTDAAGGLTQYGYDSQNRMASITDPRQIIFLQNSYDANGRVSQQIAADGGITTFSYTLLNPTVPTSPVLLTMVTDPRGNTTTYHFNPQGFLVDVTDPLGEKTVFTLDAGTNQVLSITDPLDRITAFSYDSLGNQTSVTWLAGTPEAVTSTRSYDPTFNKVTSVTDPLGHTTSFKYDRAGNLLSVTDSLNHAATFSYDTTGELTSATDRMGNLTQFSYVDGDLARVIDPLNRVTTRATDAVSRLIGLTNALGQTAEFKYNALDEMTLVTDPQHNQTSFEYDGNGNLVKVTDANGNPTTYIFDKMDRIATRTDALNHSDQYQYDLAGNLTQATDRRNVVTKYVYDSLNRRTKANFGTEESMTFAYDAASRLTEATDSLTGTVSRTFDSFNRMLTEATPQGSISYSYDAAGRRTGMTVNGQPSVAYSYDDGNRLVEISQSSSQVTFSYDNDGRRTSLKLPNGVTIGYSYDAASELTGIDYGLLGNLTYVYDPTGRRSGLGGSFARTGMPNALTSATYNVDNQLTQFGGTNLTYDAAGNLTGDGSNTYTWNARDQLVSISGSVAANFQYDALGRRVSKTVGGTTQYLYDLVNPVEELSGSSVSATILTGLKVDEYFQRTDASGTADFLTDALGSTVQLASAAGATQYTYDPFGAVAITGVPSNNSYLFTGRENDNTGLYFYRARFYSPTFQRFISEDPYGFLGGSSNLYGYAYNDPIYVTDPNGTCPSCVLGIIGGVIGGTFAGVTAYENGARGWDLAAAVAGGVGVGILSGLTGAWVGQLAADAVAPTLGLGLGTQLIGGAAGGAAGGAVSAGGDQLIKGCFDPGGIARGAAEGAAFGAIGVAAGPVVQGGENFNVMTSARTWGPRAGQAYAQATIAGVGNGLYDLATRKNDSGCPQ